MIIKGDHLVKDAREILESYKQFSTSEEPLDPSEAAAEVSKAAEILEYEMKMLNKFFSLGRSIENRLNNKEKLPTDGVSYYYSGCVVKDEKDENDESHEIIDDKYYDPRLDPNIFKAYLSFSINKKKISEDDKSGITIGYLNLIVSRVKSNMYSELFKYLNQKSKKEENFKSFFDNLIKNLNLISILYDQNRRNGSSDMWDVRVMNLTFIDEKNIMLITTYIHYLLLIMIYFYLFLKKASSKKSVKLPDIPNKSSLFSYYYNKSDEIKIKEIEFILGNLINRLVMIILQYKLKNISLTKIIATTAVIFAIILFVIRVFKRRGRNSNKTINDDQLEGGDDEDIIQKWTKFSKQILTSSDKANAYQNVNGLLQKLFGMVINGFSSLGEYDIVPDFILGVLTKNNTSRKKIFDNLADKLESRNLDQSQKEQFWSKFKGLLNQYLSSE